MMMGTQFITALGAEGGKAFLWMIYLTSLKNLFSD